MKDLVSQLSKVISLNREMDDFGRLLHESWMLKKGSKRLFQTCINFPSNLKIQRLVLPIIIKISEKVSRSYTKVLMF
jgi:hypothetical protein